MFAEIKDFLDRNLTDVVILDFEDYVKPKDMRRARDAGLLTASGAQAGRRCRRRCSTCVEPEEGEATMRTHAGSS